MKLLIFAEGATLAHVGRPLVLAREAVRIGHEVVFVRPPQYEWATRNADFEILDLRAQAPQEFARRLKRGRPLYDLATLEEYVTDDVALLRSHRPDVVVGDFRLSLAVSARSLIVPYVTLSNAYWSPYLPLKQWPVPDIPLTRVLPVAFAEAVFNAVRPLAFAMHALPMKSLRQKYGMNTDGVTLQNAYTDADAVCYCDIPGCFELIGAPTTHRIVGPLVWDALASEPEWWSSLEVEKPTIYMTLGSSGRTDMVARFAGALVARGWQVILSLAGKQMEVPPVKGLYVAEMIPGASACRRADVVICNGGSPTSQQALQAGKPVLCVPTNLDQFLNAHALCAQGVAALVRSDRFSIDKAIGEVERLFLSARPSVARFVENADLANLPHSAVAGEILEIAEEIRIH